MTGFGVYLKRQLWNLTVVLITNATPYRLG